ncbi:matrixin family metalloprotease [Arthrobacter sp. GCM10027362]|uniref:matrixin family metalloprotease n=1 Tax=Arthrobacter sp. GCM10027362 TaxID=3273379 RepID=UPI00366CB0DA
MLVFAVLAAGLALAGCSPSGGQGRGTGDGGNSAQSAPAQCVAPAGARTQDIDPEDSPVKPWRKPAGRELVVEFETGGLSERYARLVSEGTGIWSRSPCLNAVVVQSCSAGANCVTIVEDDSRSRRTDGEMEWDGDDAYMEGASITLYTRPLDRYSDNGALATVVHEMGHALGLDHRLERSDVMNAVTGDDTDPVPDAVDFANLAVLYGS